MNVVVALAFAILVAIALVCLGWPRKVQEWTIRAVDMGPIWMHRANPMQSWASRYVRDPFYIWHARIIGGIASAVVLILLLRLLHDRL